MYFLSCGLMEVLLIREMTTREVVEKKETKGVCVNEDLCGLGLSVSLSHSLSLAVGLFLYDLEGLNFQEFPLFIS